MSTTPPRHAVARRSAPAPEARPAAPEPGGEPVGGYQQELHRSLSIWATIGIALSSVTPAASVFIIAPAALSAIGTGTLTAFLLGAIIGVAMAFCWAELAAAFPVAGGDYGLVARAFGGRASRLSGLASFVTFTLMLVQGAFIPAVIALGTSEYLGVVWSVNAKVLAAVVMLLAGLIAIFNVKLNAKITGLFLCVEVAALIVLTTLGLTHWRRNPIDFVTAPVTGSGASLSAVGFSAILAFTATAIFSYNGYNGAVFFAEETRGHSRRLARAIIWSLAITVVAEVLPLTAVMIGAPSLHTLVTSPLPLEYFITSTSSHGLYDVVSIGIALAILNAVIALVLMYGRILYASGRDRAWPAPVNRALSTVHPGLGTPWFATAVVAIVGAVLSLTVDINTLITFTGAGLVASYALVAAAGLIGRLTRATDAERYHMPWWPLAPIVALGGLGYVVTQQTAEALEVTGAAVAIGLAYWLVFLLPRRKKAWVMLEPIFDAEE